MAAAATTKWTRSRLPTPTSPRRAEKRQRTENTQRSGRRRRASREQAGQDTQPGFKIVPYASPVSRASDNSDTSEDDLDTRCNQNDLNVANGSALPAACDERMSHATVLPLAHLLLTSLFAAFDGQPLFPLSGFIKEMVGRSGTSPECLALGLLYLWRCRDRIARSRQLADQANMSTSGTIPHPSLCSRRMFLSALIIAWKFLSDRTYTNSAWSKISGLRVEEINANERCLLGMLGWTLDVKPTEWAQWHAWIISMKPEVDRVLAADPSLGVVDEKVPVTLTPRRLSTDEETLHGSPLASPVWVS